MIILIFLLLLGHGWASILPNGCPSDFETHALLPHETDCSKFYQCSNGKKVLMQCPKGTLFDVKLQICEWASSVDCSPLTTTTTTTTTTSTTTEPPLSTTITTELSSSPSPTTINPSTSTTTIIPTSSLTTTTINPSSLTTTKITTPISTTTSSQPSTTTTTTTTTSRPTTPNDCPADLKIILGTPHDIDCDKYLSCSDGIKLLLKCPVKDSFDLDLQLKYEKKYRNRA